ncbi:L,D-transpeptidase family protein [Clostridium magnum]|uniref:Putative L,D-transpeptidase YkuD n=1 Tax=Clostridium magnum DSM 2767 TaxID=1121326 RepID=A0A162THJ3_9CLOT|nr:L,D-transpeptidase family protein [Clostridium magnum]KZL92651.1 putative L,D-transpeptidase YkuD [Clostridium magnum DSM 2767]SHI24188.1 Putative peptidoglycan binding domain-containing protein [Clostridium magnum DSM 2767]
MKVHRDFFGAIFLAFILFFSNGTKVYAISSEKKVEIKHKYNILVDVSEFDLYLIDKNTNKVVKVYPIAGGKPSTPSPYGTWKIISKAANWGTGFGTRWMQLGIPWGKYGIHGTNKPLTINNPDSLGCIRMFNSDIEELYGLVDCGTEVVVYGGPYGLSSNVFRMLLPGDRGADVFEVQRRLKGRGYYSGTLDGIYENELKQAVIKFRIDNKLKFTHNIDKEFYNALEMIPFE